MRMTLVLAGLLGLSLLVGCAIVPLDPYWGRGHGGYHSGHGYGGHGYYERGYNRGYYRSGSGYYR